MGKQDKTTVSFRLPVLAIEVIESRLQEIREDQSINISIGQFCQEIILDKLGMSVYDTSYNKSAFVDLVRELISEELIQTNGIIEDLTLRVDALKEEVKILKAPKTKRPSTRANKDVNIDKIS